MKRETKKKIVNITLVSAITSSVLAPISIALGKLVSDQITLNNKRILEKDTQTNEEHLNEISQINEDFTFDINIDTRMKIDVANPNLTKAIPNGYVVVVGDSYNNKKIVCLDKKNPSKILWELAPEGTLNLNFYSIEYTPYNNGTIVLLYSTVSNDKQASSNATIKYAAYSNIDNLSNSSYLQPTKKESFTYNNTSGGGRLDTWALTPVFNDNAQVTRYFAYCKDWTKDNNSKNVFLPIFLDQNTSFSSKFSVRNNDLSFVNFKIILSTLSIKHSSGYFIGVLGLSTDNKIKLVAINTQEEAENEFWYTKVLSTSGTLNFDDNYLISLAKSSINNSIISSDNQFAFLINFNSNKQTIHSNSFFFTGNIITAETLKGLSLNYNSEKTFGNNTEIFNGYFINEQIISKGIKSSNSFSFVGVGKSSSLSSTEKFALTIKNVFSNSVYNVSDDLDSANWRIYKINENSKSDQENIYSGWTTSSSTNDETGLGFNQGLLGLPILDYLQNNEDIFSKNILFTKNGSSKAIIINQKERDQNTKNKSSYGYYTRISSEVFNSTDLFSSNKIKDVNKEVIKSVIKTKLKDFILNKTSALELELVDDDSLKIHYNEGILEFSFSLKNFFDEKGHFNSTETKTIKIRVEKFQPAITQLKDKINIYNQNYKNTKNQTSSVFIPAFNIINDQNNDKFWDLREIVWKALISNEIFDKDALKQFPEEGTTLEEKKKNFNNFFKKFEWKTGDNSEGIITASFTISKDYSFKNEDTSFEDVKFWGLRKIDDTKILPINENSPLKNTEWENVNIPYLNTKNNNDITRPDYVPNDVKIITKEQLKSWIISSVFSDAYKNAKEENGFSATKESVVENLPYKNTLEEQNGKAPTEVLGSNDFELSNFEFFPTKGMMSFEISLNSWYEDGRYYTKNDGNISKAPKAKWHVSGFRKDNVTTYIDENNVWKLDSLGGIVASQALSNENIKFVKRRILEYGYSNKHISLPYWVNLKSLDDLKLEIIESDDTFGTVNFKVFIKNGMFEETSNGQVVEIKEDDGEKNWKKIKISGFSNKDSILIDSSKFWDKSSSIYDQRIMYDVEKQNNEDFDSFLENLEKEILKYISEEDAKKRPDDIQESPEEWGKKITFKYFLDNSNDSYTREQLQKQINNTFLNTRGKFNFFYNTKNNLGIKLWIKIEPKSSNIKLPLSDSSIDESKGKELKGLINTSGITMSFNLEKWFENLETTSSTTVQSIDIDKSTISYIIPPILKTSDYGNNISFIYMEALLKNAGYKFEYSWKNAQNIEEKKESLPSNFSFNLTEKTIKLKISYSLQELNSSKEIFPFYIFAGSSSSIQQSYSKDITLSLALFSVLRVNLEYLKDLSFEGSTNNLSNFESLKTKEEQIIKKIKEENKKIANNEETKNQIDSLDLDILYSINKERINSNNVWLTLEEMNEILKKQKINFSSNRVYAKYVIKSNSENLDFRLSSEAEYEINQEQFTSSAKFKVYIHNTKETTKDWIYENLKVQGTQTEYEIQNYSQWINRISKGLKVQFNTSRKPGKPEEPDQEKWSDIYRQDIISNTKEFWIRFKVKDGFIFEGSQDPIKLDTSKISVVLKLESSLLETHIKLSGNTKNLEIDESNLREYLDTYGLNPVDNIIKVQYTIEGIYKWYDKESFKTRLIELNGSLDNESWIIRREDIKARFIIDPDINNTLQEKYYLSIDGIFISNEEDIPAKSIITDKYNHEVKGYINVDRIKEIFFPDNFEVIGTNNQAILLTKKVNQINKMISRYSKSNVFQLLYTNNSNNDFSNVRNSIINNSGLIDEYTYLNGNFSEKYFALSFIGEENYQVYENDKELEKGYILSSPDIKVNIRIEIENPFIGRQVSIKFTDKDNKPIFYQNEGGFDVLIKDNNSSENKNFSQFISSLTIGVGENKWTKEQIEAMELVYFVSNTKLSDDQLKQIIKYDKIYEESDQNQKYGVWKTLDPNNKRENLNLLVNDYVTIAIRVKRDKINQNDTNFIMKEYDDFVPLQSRVYGYKIKSDSIAIDFESLSLKNVGQAESSSSALDGYAQLKSISLTKDENKNYLGVSLKLNFFTEFHRDSKNQILVSNSGQRLVKRNPNDAETKGYYKNSKGEDLVDKEGNRIPILEKYGILSEPIKNSLVTRYKELVDIGDGNFVLQLSQNDSNAEYSFFKKQLIEFEISNKKGEAIGDEFDYYMDNNQIIKITYTLDKEIKSPIPNEKNIKYEFNSKEFVENLNDPSKLLQVYQNSYNPSEMPYSGQSKIIAMFSITRTENNTNPTKLDTLEKIQNQILSDFEGKVILRATHFSLDGKTTVINDGDISQIKDLKNGDKFKIEIVSANENNWIFANQPAPLIFAVSSLFEKSIEKSILKNLRVKQSGEFNGEGKFSIYVDDPKEGNSTANLDQVLGGFNFLVRVWDDRKIIKYDWTKDFSLISNLKNGDKVEWKLVSPNNLPLYESYYNTIANVDNHKANENIYSFSIVNQTGISNSNITQPIEGIGTNPINENEYPENSGFKISGLKEKEDSLYTTINFEEFTRLMNLMNFSYIGPNGSGDMISNKSILDVEVNTIGKSSTKFTLDYLINNNYLQFYYNNNTSTKLNNFNWNQVKDENGHWLTSPGTLSNGDIVKITYKDPTMSAAYEYYAPIVSGLKEKVDNMAMFTWIGIGVATLVTLGIFALIYLHSTKKKLK